MNIMQIMKQAQNMQAKVKNTKEELEKMEFIGEAAGGAVTIVCDGFGRFKSIKLRADAINSENPDAVDSESIEMLEDLITSAINQANDKATKEMEAKMKEATGGINIPGLF